MNRRWINTKVEFIWDGSQYVEQSAEGYWYDGEMALCTTITHDTGADELFLVGQLPEGTGYNCVTLNGDLRNAYKLGWTGGYSQDPANMYHDVPSGGAHHLRVAAAVQMKISAGPTYPLVGIGTSSPENYHESPLVTYKAQANYITIASDADGTTSILFSDGTTDSEKYEGQLEYVHSSNEFRMYTNHTKAMTIDDSQNVGIGTESPSYELEVAGSFYSSGSSVDFKKHVTDMAIDSSAIYDLNPVSYEYKKDYENFGYDLAGGKQVGLLSEDVAKTVPELAIMKDGKAQNVDYQKLSVLLLAEMKKLNKRIETLEAQ